MAKKKIIEYVGANLFARLEEYMNNAKMLKIIKILIVVLIAIFVISVSVYLIQKRSLENATYESVESIPSNMAAVTFMKCKFIKEEESPNKNYSIDIYLKFGKPLYDGDESNEVYYSQLVQIAAIVNKYKNFRLIDEENEILIAVACDEEKEQIDQIVINGDPYYYSRENAIRELKQFTETPITEFDIQAEELEKLISEDWQTDKLNLQYSNEFDDGYMYYPMNYIEIRTIHGKAFNIIFDGPYESYILNDLKVNSTFEEIIEEFGKPTFGSVDEHYIGYKGKEIYVFFSEGEVSIYRVQDIDKTDFSNEIAKYFEEKDVKKFVSNITDIWQDYDMYDYNENMVDLSYTLNGVKIQYGVSERHGITFYNNYTGVVIDGKTCDELVKENIEIPKYIYFINKDSVDEFERNRLSTKFMIEYGEEDQIY